MDEKQIYTHIKTEEDLFKHIIYLKYYLGNELVKVTAVGLNEYASGIYDEKNVTEEYLIFNNYFNDARKIIDKENK